jgi:predicted Fe-Mo cluster-binding NifX family protein
LEEMDMKIAVSSSGKHLDSQIDPRFGRCAHFVIVETDDMSFEAFDNESIALGGGAGIQAAQFVANKGAKAIITGNVGPNAVQTLSASHVEIFTGQFGAIRDAVEKFKRGEIKPTITPNVVDHYGMRGGGGMGRGMGMGRGGGMGRGQGMGRGMGGSQRTVSDRPDSNASSKEGELQSLKDKADELRKQIEAIESSITSMEKR